MRLYNYKTFLRKAFKVLDDFNNKLFNFEKFLIYVLPKIKMKLNMGQLSFIFLCRKSNPKC